MNKLRTFFVVCFLLALVSCRPALATLTLALLGDLTLGRGVQPSQASLAYLAPDLQAADLALANLESPLTADPPLAGDSSSYNLCASASRAGLLMTWGLDLLALANNHQDDCGPGGLEQTASLLRAAGLYPVGSRLNSLTWETPGVKVTFLAYDDVASPLDEKAAVQEIWQAHAYKAQVVVFIHWGLEYQSGPTARQKALARQFVEAGAALVVGTHPHVLQPAEWINTSEGKTLVLYSLGNALFDQPGLPDTRQSALVMVQLGGQGVQSVRAVPFVINVPGSRVESPDAQAAEQIRERLGME